MRESALTTRIGKFVNSMLESLSEEVQPAAHGLPRKETVNGRTNRPARREVFYYTPLIDDKTKELAGHLADISTGGFKMDSRIPLPDNTDFRFRMKLSNDLADKPELVFMARSKWCRLDPLDPTVYNIGFQLLDMAPGDIDIFNRMMQKYGWDYVNKVIDLRRSNKW